MPTYSTDMKNAAMAARRDLVAGGDLEILDSSNTLLIKYDLTAVGGTVASGVWTLAFDLSTVAAVAAGTAAKAQIKDSGTVAQVTAITVGLTGSGADLIFDNTNVQPGQEVTITSATISSA